MIYLLTFYFVALLIVFKAKAYPTGAGGCVGGLPAVGGDHVEINKKAVVPGFLDQSGVSFFIGGQQILKEAKNIFPVGEDLEVEASSSNVPIKGILVRIERKDGVDSTGALAPGENTKLADYVCSPPVTGITHFSSENKNTARGTIRFDEAVESVICEVTVVFENNATLSSFAYDSFNLQFEGSLSTKEPVSAVPDDTTTLQPTSVATETGGTVYPTITIYPSTKVSSTFSPTDTTDNSSSPSPASKPPMGDSIKPSDSKSRRGKKGTNKASKGSYNTSKAAKNPRTSKKMTKSSKNSSHQKIVASAKSATSTSAGNAKDDGSQSRRQLLRRV